MAIKLIDVSYKNIFEKVNFEIDKGQIVAIVGEGASGKTTLFDLIFGQDLEFDGRIIFGRKTLDKSRKTNNLKEIRKDMFYLKQEHYDQLFNINVLEDINYFVESYSEIELQELIKTFGLNVEVLKKHYSELSTGEIKKVLLIIAFLSNKKILLLDDVTAELDLKGKKTLLKQLKKEKREGIIIFLSSADTNFILEAADSILCINDRKIKIEKDKYNFFSNKSVLNKCNIAMPKILEFKNVVLKRKKIKLLYRDNINDLIKDIYRNAK